MDLHWIDNAESLKDFCDSHLASASEIAVDTESDQFHAYNPVICLVQVATRDVAALVDPLAMDPEHLKPLWDTFADPKIEKILHSANNDLHALDRDHQVVFRNVFDTQIAGRFLRYERDGLAFFLDLMFGVKASKQFQRFDWKTRPLPNGPKVYAAEDVIYLHAMRDKMLRLLQEDGWFGPFEEACEYMVTSSGWTDNGFDEEAWRKIKYPKDFSGRQRAILRELFLCRHDICTQLNYAPFHVLPNAQLVSLAIDAPITEGAVTRTVRLRELARPFVSDVAEAVKRGMTAEPPPARAPRKSPKTPKPTPEEEDRYQSLRGWRNTKAEVEDLPFELIASNATLRLIAKVRPSSVEELGAIDGILNWQIDEFGDEVMSILVP